MGAGRKTERKRKKERERRENNAKVKGMSDAMML